MELRKEFVMKVILLLKESNLMILPYNLMEAKYFQVGNFT
jgi:hypothetical protein